MRLSRRKAAFMIAAAALPLRAGPSRAAPQTIKVTKDPNCACCSGWVEHLRADGFAVTVAESTELDRVKARLGVPAELQSCHTAEIDSYVIEGHVPATTIRRLLAERPQALGLAVPGMPVGSPGMEVAGAPAETYEVVLFGRAERRVFARFKGSAEIGR